MDREIKLNEKERALFIYLFKILKNQDDGEYDYDNMIKALQYGFEYHYNDVFDCLFDEELSAEGCKEVLDILEMYRGITYSYINLERVGKLKDLKREQICFRGFDGNNETKQMSYATYFIVDLDRYSEIQEYSLGNDYNSHCRLLPKYRAMLKKWKEYDGLLENRYMMDYKHLTELLSCR